MKKIHSSSLILLLVIMCTVESFSPSVPCRGVKCEQTFCPNPFFGICCNVCLEDCREIFCARPNCLNPVTPLGRCCPVCPNDCSSVLCALPTCPNPIPAGPGQCCPKCTQNCAVVSCLIPDCPNAIVPPGLCCPVCPSPPLPIANDICELPSITGPCRASIPRWFYNSKTKQCEQFTYGGCGGNENRFEDLRSCLSRCASKCPPGTPIVQCFADPCSVTQCSSFPNAICISNFCGGCNAQFFLNNGTEVTNKCSIR